MITVGEIIIPTTLVNTYVLITRERIIISVLSSSAMLMCNYEPAQIIIFFSITGPGGVTN